MTPPTEILSAANISRTPAHASAVDLTKPNVRASATLTTRPPKRPVTCTTRRLPLPAGTAGVDPGTLSAYSVIAGRTAGELQTQQVALLERQPKLDLGIADRGHLAGEQSAGRQ